MCVSAIDVSPACQSLFRVRTRLHQTQRDLRIRNATLCQDSESGLFWGKKRDIQHCCVNANQAAGDSEFEACAVQPFISDPNPLSGKVFNELLVTARDWCTRINEPFMVWKSGHLSIDNLRRVVYNARCPQHVNNEGLPCPKRYRASAATADRVRSMGLVAPTGAGPEMLLVEGHGEHFDEEIEARRKHRLAKEFAKFTPAAAGVAMTNVGVVDAGRLRRSIAGVRYRTGRRDGAGLYGGHFVASLRRFIANPPAPVSIEPAPVSVASEDIVRVVFYNRELLDHAMHRFVQGRGSLKLVADGTYNTNVQKLVVVCVGLVFVVNDKGRVHNRFIPLTNVLANRENEDAYAVAMQMLLDYGRTALGEDIAEQITDIYIDGHGGAENAVAQVLPNVRLHRCLQHIKKNIRDHAQLVRRRDFVEWLVDAAEFTAKLPRLLDFEGVWRDILLRMEDEQCWNERDMARYLRAEILKEEAGVFRCLWRSGMDAVMAGYRSYVSNTEERMWRTLKGLLGNYATLDCTQLILQICQIYRSMAQQHNFQDLRVHIEEPLDRMLNDPNPGAGGRLADNSQHRLLTVARIVDTLRHYEAQEIYMHEHIDWDVVVNHVAKRATDLFIVPKYQLRFGIEQRDRMELMFRILAAQELGAWQLAFGESGYNMEEHRRVFERFTAVYRFADGTFFDIHKDFLAEQQTSHSHYIRGLWERDEIQRPAAGPRSTRAKNLPKRAQRTEAFKDLLKRTSQERMPAMISLPAPAAAVESDGILDQLDDVAESHVLPSSQAAQLPSVGGSSNASAGLRNSLDAYARGVAAKRAPEPRTNEPNQTRCLARVWGGGAGGQCTRKRKYDVFCGQHQTEESRKHGQVNEPVPPAVQHLFNARKGRGVSKVQNQCSEGADAKVAGSSTAASSSPNVAGVPASSEPDAAQKARHMARGSRAGRENQASLLRQALEEAMFRTAAAESLISNLDMLEERQRQTALIAERLQAYGRERVDTEAFGSCQFIAVQQSGGLGMSPVELRALVCDYMQAFAEEISAFLPGLAPNPRGFASYLTEMEDPSGWGDDCTLAAMAHILSRPVQVVSDHSDGAYVRVIEPPASVARRDWGPPIVVALYGERHYEATRPAPADRAASEHAELAAGVVAADGSASGSDAIIPELD